MPDIDIFRMDVTQMMDELQRRMSAAEFKAFAGSVAQNTPDSYRACVQKLHELECLAGNHWFLLVNGARQCYYCGASDPRAPENAPDRGAPGNPVSSSSPRKAG